MDHIGGFGLQLFYLGNRVDDFDGIEMLKVRTIGRVDSTDTIIQHSGYEKVVEDRLRLGTVFFDELGYSIHSLSQGDYDPDMTTSIKFNKLFCFYRG